MPGTGQGVLPAELREQAVAAVEAFLRERGGHGAPNGIVDAIETYRTERTEAVWTLTLERRQRNGIPIPVATLTCPLAASAAGVPIAAIHAPVPAVIIRYDKFLLGLSLAALALGRPVQTPYRYFRETCRAHPDGRLETFETPPPP